MDTINTVNTIEIKKPRLLWHKFMAFFFLWVCSFLAFKTGMFCITGAALGQNKEVVYAAFPSIHYLFAVFGAVAIVIAGFTVYVCVELIRYKKDAPKDLIIALASQIIASLIFEVVAGTILGFENMDFTQTAITVILQSLVLAVNVVYFKKNKAYFTK